MGVVDATWFDHLAKHNKAALSIFFTVPLLLQACGPTPAFRDIRDETTPPPHAEQIVDENGIPPGPNGEPTGPNAMPPSQSDGGDPSTDVEVDGGEADGSSDGSGSDGGSDGGTGDEGTTDGGSGGDAEHDDGDDGSEFPGEKVERVGINFEDLPNGDFDFNDAVLCFEGFFKVDGSSVVSYKRQTIRATTFSASACAHRVDVQVIHPNGKIDTVSYASTRQDPVNLQFVAGSRLEVSITPRVNTETCSRGETTMHDPDYVQVLLDRCNLSGE